MRKFLVFFTVLAVLAVSVMPSFAQDGEGDMEPTIADIVVEAATAEDGAEFTALLAAVGAADPAVLDALSDPEADLTVFAPTDAAFAALGEETLTAVLEDTELVTEILLFHVIEGSVYSEDVVGLLEETDGAFTVESLQGQYIDVEVDEMGDVYIDGAPLILEMVDIEAANGVIHVIDAVMLPEARTIAEIVVDAASAEEDAEFTALLEAVSEADPAVLDALSDPEAELTVFAPTDAAFDALGEETLAAVLGDTELLTSVLLYHVIDGIVSAQDAGEILEMEDMEMGFDVETLLGATFTVSADEEGIYINDAQVIITNIDAANGMIHVIDAVLVPAAEAE